jgi:hypothetical protein
VIDVVQVLTESKSAKRYWSDLKRKLAQEAGSEKPYEEIVQLKLTATGGKQRETDCAKAATLLRIIQSIPSPKAEPIKLWLAKVGYERMQEMADPALTLAVSPHDNSGNGSSRRNGTCLWCLTTASLPIQFKLGIQDSGVVL